MSEHTGTMNANRKSAFPAKGSSQRRWTVYAVVAVIAVLTLAYVDAGEEPIRPIIQPVEMPSSGAGDE